jgi:hypothetical protein
MTDTLPPLTDLGLLQREILSQPPDAALPANLPDPWLKLIARDLEALVSEDRCSSEVSARSIAAPLALIYRLLEGKGGEGGTSIPVEVLEQYLFELWIEVSSVLVSRSTQTQFEPATLQSIFTNRELALRTPICKPELDGHVLP